MGKRVVRVTFPDGTKMYSPYSTVSDYMGPVALALPAHQERMMEEGVNEGEEDEADLLWRLEENSAWPRAFDDNVPLEPVICTVLNYGDYQTWAAVAQRQNNSAVIRGYLCLDDWMSDVSDYDAGYFVSWRPDRTYVLVDETGSHRAHFPIVEFALYYPPPSGWRIVQSKVGMQQRKSIPADKGDSTIIDASAPRKQSGRRWLRAIAALVILLAVGVVGGRYAGQADAKSTLERLGLIWPHVMSMPMDDRAFLANLSLECRLSERRADRHDVLDCLSKAASSEGEAALSRLDRLLAESPK